MEKPRVAGLFFRRVTRTDYQVDGRREHDHDDSHHHYGHGDAQDHRHHDLNLKSAYLHVWRVGQGAYACEISLLTKDVALTPARVREQLSIHGEIVHVTVEINRHG